MSFHTLKQQTIKYDLIDGDIVLRNGKYKDERISDLILSKDGYHYLRYIVMNNYVTDEFINILSNITNFDERELEARQDENDAWWSGPFDDL